MFGKEPVGPSSRRLSNPFVNTLIVLDPATSCHNKLGGGGETGDEQNQKPNQYNQKNTFLLLNMLVCHWVFLALAHLSSLTTAEHRYGTLKEPSTTIPISVAKFTSLEQVHLSHLKSEWV